MCNSFLLIMWYSTKGPYMKRVFVVFILFFLLPSVMLFPQNKQNEPQQKNSKKAKIAVFRPTNLEEQSRFDGVCIAIEETIALNLKLIGSYEIIEPSMAAPETEDALLAYMQENAVDNAVYGDLFIDDSGAIAVEISVFDRKEKGVTSTEKVSAGSYFLGRGNALFLTVKDGYFYGYCTGIVYKQVAIYRIINCVFLHIRQQRIFSLRSRHRRFNYLITPDKF